MPAVRQVGRAADYGYLRADPTDGRQVAVSQGLAGKFGESIGPALRRGAIVARGGRSHQRIERGGDGCATLGVELTSDEQHSVEAGESKAAPGEVGPCVGFGSVGVDVGADPVACALNVVRVTAAGKLDQCCLDLADRVDADAFGEPADAIHMVDSDLAGKRCLGEYGQLSQHPGRSQLGRGGMWRHAAERA